MRTTLVRSAVVGALAAAVAAFSSAFPAAANPPQVGSSFYVVRPDPRLCPSPLCGGYWASLANHSRTRCHDGLLRPRCYIARAVGEDRRPLTAGLPDQALARATIETWSYEGFGKLGVLVVADVFSPAGRALASGSFHRVVDTGIRCVREPCFSLRASRLNRPDRKTVSEVDLGSAQAAPEDLERAEAALRTKNGLLVRGRIVASSDDGRLFRATRLFLRSER